MISPNLACLPVSGSGMVRSKVSAANRLPLNWWAVELTRAGFTGTELKGPAKLERTFALNDIPVYVKAGAIVPMQPKMRNTAEKPVDPLILTVFPGNGGETRVYEDAGNTPGYTHGEAAWTTVRHARLDDGTRRIEILPIEGGYPGLPASRGYEVRLPSTLPPESVRADGTDISYSRDGTAPGWHYDGATLTTVISVPRTSVSRKVDVVVQTPAAPQMLVDGVPGKLARLRAAMDILNTTWPRGWSPDILIDAAQAGRRMTLHPETARQELEKLQRDMPVIVDTIRKMDVDCAALVRALGHLGRTASCVPAIK